MALVHRSSSAQGDEAGDAGRRLGRRGVVLHGDLTPAAGLQHLLSREQKPEYPETLFK